MDEAERPQTKYCFTFSFEKKRHDMTSAERYAETIAYDLKYKENVDGVSFSIKELPEETEDKEAE